MKAIDQVEAWLEEGKVNISPRELAALIGGNPYSYSISAKNGHLGIPYVYAGRNLRISLMGVKHYLLGDTALYKS